MDDHSCTSNAKSEAEINELQSLLLNAQNRLARYHLSINYTLHAPQTMNEQLAQYFAHSLFALNGCCPVTLLTKHLLVLGSVHVQGKCINDNDYGVSNIDHNMQAKI